MYYEERRHILSDELLEQASAFAQEHGGPQSLVAFGLLWLADSLLTAGLTIAGEVKDLRRELQRGRAER